MIKSTLNKNTVPPKSRPFKQGDLVEGQGSLIVMVEEVVSDINFSGQVIYKGDCVWLIGYYATNWDISSFTLLPESDSVTLQNDFSND